MEKHDNFLFSLTDLGSYSLEEAEEKKLYVRYLMQRENEESRQKHYYAFLELLEQRISKLKTGL